MPRLEIGVVEGKSLSNFHPFSQPIYNFTNHRDIEKGQKKKDRGKEKQKIDKEQKIKRKRDREKDKDMKAIRVRKPQGENDGE